MPKHSQDPTQGLGVTDTPTYLYPSSDNTVLLSDADYDDQPFKTGKHSVVRGKRVGASQQETRDPFAPKTVAPPAAEDDIVLTKTKRNGCLRSAIFVVVACIVAVAAFVVVCSYGM